MGVSKTSANKFVSNFKKSFEDCDKVRSELLFVFNIDLNKFEIFGFNDAD